MIDFLAEVIDTSVKVTLINFAISYWLPPQNNIVLWGFIFISSYTAYCLWESVYNDIRVKKVFG